MLLFYILHTCTKSSYGQNPTKDKVGESLSFLNPQTISKHAQPKPNLKSDRHWPLGHLELIRRLS